MEITVPDRQSQSNVFSLIFVQVRTSTKYSQAPSKTPLIIIIIIIQCAMDLSGLL